MQGRETVQGSATAQSSRKQQQRSGALPVLSARSWGRFPGALPGGGRSFILFMKKESIM